MTAREAPTMSASERRGGERANKSSWHNGARLMSPWVDFTRGFGTTSFGKVTHLKRLLKLIFDSLSCPGSRHVRAQWRQAWTDALVQGQKVHWIRSSAHRCPFAQGSSNMASCNQDLTGRRFIPWPRRRPWQRHLCQQRDPVDVTNSTLTASPY